MEKIDKVVRVGTVPGDFARDSLYARIKFDGTNLSITGVVGPMKNGNAKGGCGQIIMDFKEYDDRGFMSLSDIDPAPAWNAEMIKRFFDTWDEWHLNDMQSACEHQRALGWKYDDHHDPKTFKGELCPVCGYSIGSAWLLKDVPQDVIDFLKGLPDTDEKPAWV